MKSQLTSIDWVTDAVRDRRLKHNTAPTWAIVSAIQSWLVLLLVGVTVGVMAATINVSHQWLAGLREGVCYTGFYLNKYFCCWQMEAGDECNEWVPWATVLGVRMEFAFYWLQYLLYVLLGVVFASCSALLVREHAPFAAGSGIPELKSIQCGFILHGFLNVKTLLIKSIGLVLSVASGLSLGKEGPLVHIAACCGHLYCQLFTKFRYNEARQREVSSAAVAAGITVAFGAPIGGVLFSLEEISYYFPYKTMWRSFFCAIAAAVTLRFMNPFRTGKLVMFQTTFTNDWHAFDVAGFVFLGVLGGLFGAFFNKLVLAIVDVRNRNATVGRYPILQVAAVSLLTSVVSYTNIFMRVDTTELVSYLFRECKDGDFEGICDQRVFGSTAGLVFLAGLAKIFLTLLCVGLHIPAWIYMPTMAIGACTGRAIGMFVQTLHSQFPTLFVFASCPVDPEAHCITPGKYALVGAAAAMGGVTRTSVSLVVIMLELTGALSMIIPIMLAVTVSKWVGDAFTHEGLDTALVKHLGYPFIDNRRHKPNYAESASSTNIVSKMTPTNELTLLYAEGMPLSDVEGVLRKRVTGYPVVDTNHVLKGYMLRRDLRTFISILKNRTSQEITVTFLHTNRRDMDGGYLVSRSPTIITVHTPYDMVLDLFSRMGMNTILITHHGQLQGIITKKDIL
jgi:chloride channel 3/4/5